MLAWHLRQDENEVRRCPNRDHLNLSVGTAGSRLKIGSSTSRLVGSSMKGYKSRNMGYNYSFHEPPSSSVS